MFGSHLSIAGALHNALMDARRLKMDCVQVFTANQRQWKTKDLTPDAIEAWQEHRAKTKIATPVSHASYLINLAGPTGETRDKSIALFRKEHLRCAALGIRNVVVHPGAHLGDGDAKGIRRIAGALNKVHKDLPDVPTVTCLEGTAGQGSSIGWRFEHLSKIIGSVADPSRLAVCLDTAHLIEAGYDLTSATGCGAVIEEFDHVVGLDLLKIWHINDSKTPLGSRVDRHEHIGHGHISPHAFAHIVQHPRFKDVPKILETPKGESPDGRPWDTINLAKLRRMMRPKPTGARKGKSIRKRPMKAE